MKYSDMTKKVRLTLVEEREINTLNCFAQYNPDRFKVWCKCCSSNLDPLSISFAPHMELLDLLYKDKTMDWTKTLQRQAKATKYFHMHLLYGKSPAWALRKCRSVRDMFLEIIRDEQVKEPVTLLTRPLVDNPYTDGFEIYEGHHRVSICHYLGFPVLARIFDPVL